MAEDIIHPQVAPPNAPQYHFPGWYYYTPEPYHTTSIPKHARHMPAPLKAAQHAVRDLTHPYADGYPLPSPHTDIRESRSAYYLDVELPGLRDKKDVRLKWTGARSLFIEAYIQPQPLPQQASKPSSPEPSPAGPSSEMQTAAQHEVDKNEEETTHYLKKERKTGQFARAFNFPVDIKQDETVAKLAFGVLTIMVPKKEKDSEEKHKEVAIEHAGH
ncbi:hypothetical protein M406DRAFT_69122 [Cryphonectria parasitica EP155]|uniref:SHSP domain-containing protein n=2 Tax=Cryphonectria parasitica TaxID=5116 RepID=A0A9P4Y5M1_CRYP1|nr:uncharacterized protein M406DRAFT_69122 [Cryphonectria parasitica EP155]AGV80544.1 small heat shock protein [Cryphonectria parasitica]KAF3766945.1 hypothetical protein M406DRAFT_69122 [Cryphonectria parasitica EP155]